MDPSQIGLRRYCEAHTTPQDQLLKELERETYLKTLNPQMVSGHLQGTLLKLLSQMIRPKQILEIGTFTGYATLCLAQGLPEDGILHTIEANKELAYLIEKYLERSGMKSQMSLHIGQAQEIIPEIAGNFDLVFIDAGKLDYQTYYDLIINRVNPGGLILADNVLWGGKVIDDQNREKTTEFLRQFNDDVQSDPRVENLLLPIRDGMMIMRRV